MEHLHQEEANQEIDRLKKELEKSLNERDRLMSLAQYQGKKIENLEGINRDLSKRFSLVLKILFFSVILYMIGTFIPLFL